MAKISVVIPVYSEQDCLEPMLQRLLAVQAADPADEYEFIFVDDGSYDATPSILREMSAREPKVKYLSFSRNFGHEAALAAGMDHAFGAAVVTLDGDLQHPPEAIAQLVAKWREGYRIVYAQRQSSESIPWVKDFTSRAFYRLIRHWGEIDLPPNTANFRLMDQQVVRHLRLIREHGRFGRGLVAWTGFKSASVPYQEDRRFAGQTKYSMWKSARLAGDAFLGFSQLPLKLIAWTGEAFLAAAVLILLASLLRGALSARAAGATGLICASVFFVGGMLLLMMGLLGAYVGRIHRQSQGRPLYIVAEKSPSLSQDYETRPQT